MIPSPGHPKWGYYYGAEQQKSARWTGFTYRRKNYGIQPGHNLCTGEGWQPKNGEPRVLPIYPGTTFKYSPARKWENCSIWRREGYFYSRLQNPTNDVVAQKICDLEGGVAAMLTSSGQAATMLAVTNIL